MAEGQSERFSVPTLVLVASVLLIGVVTAGWMLLPARAEGNCLPPGRELPQAAAAIALASVVGMAIGFWSGLRYRAVALVLSAVLIVSALVFGFIGVFFVGDTYLPEVLEARVACGRTAAEAEAWGWLVALPSVGIALATAASVLKRPWGAILAIVTAVSFCMVIVGVFVT